MTIKHTEEFSSGGVRFEIRVVRREGFLWGEWTCLQCTEKYASSAWNTTVAGAVESARTTLMRHCAVHGG